MIAQQVVVQQLIISRGLDDNADDLWATMTLIVMVAAIVGGWIGFVYSDRSASDRGLILLSCWGLSTALGVAVLFATLPVSPAHALEGVAEDFCTTKTQVYEAIVAVQHARTADQLFANSAAAVGAFDTAADNLHDQARRAADAGAAILASNLDQAAGDFTQLAESVRRLDGPGLQAPAADLAKVVSAIRRTEPIADRCGFSNGA